MQNGVRFLCLLVLSLIGNGCIQFSLWEQKSYVEKLKLIWGKPPPQWTVKEDNPERILLQNQNSGAIIGSQSQCPPANSSATSTFLSRLQNVSKYEPQIRQIDSHSPQVIKSYTGERSGKRYHLVTTEREEMGCRLTHFLLSPPEGFKDGYDFFLIWIRQVDWVK